MSQFSIYPEASVEEHTIRTRDRELVFRGELIAEVEKQVSLDDAISVRVKPQVFAVEGGGYVATLECKFPQGFEDSYQAFEEIEALQDVENFFYLFDPDEIFGDAAAGPEEDVRVVKRRLDHCSTQYEKMIFAFLDVLQLRASALGTTDKPKSSKHKGKSFWQKLGIG